MPTSSEVVFPKTKDANEFEDMVCDVCKKKYNKEFQRYGRAGQKQSGIDIISDVDGTKNLICVQCKNYKISTKDIENIIKEVKDFDTTINEFVIATSASRDTKVQDYIIKFNKDNECESNFHVTILFWEEISEIIASHKKLFEKYFPKLSKKDSKKIKKIISKFNELIKEYHIIEFMSEDPIVGLPKEYPSSVDLFVETMREILIKNNVLQRKKKIIAIKQFVDMIDDYNDVLSLKLHLVNNIFRPLNNDANINLKLSKEISKYREKLDNLYSEINKNCSMFFTS